MIVITRSSETPNWRKHWLVENVLAEIPIFGSFFKISNLSGALHDAGKCVAALAGGAVMMATVHSHEDNPIKNIATATASMAVGMTAGKVIYNGIYASASTLCFYFKPGIKQNIIDDVELQPIAEQQHTISFA